MFDPFRGRRHKCIDCRCCDPVGLMCYPEDEDCESNYDLDRTELYTEAPCDFFKPIHE